MGYESRPAVESELAEAKTGLSAVGKRKKGAEAGGRAGRTLTASHIVFGACSRPRRSRALAPHGRSLNYESVPVPAQAPFGPRVAARSSSSVEGGTLYDPMAPQGCLAVVPGLLASHIDFGGGSDRLRRAAPRTYPQGREFNYESSPRAAVKAPGREGRLAFNFSGGFVAAMLGAAAGGNKANRPACGTAAHAEAADKARGQRGRCLNYESAPAPARTKAASGGAAQWNSSGALVKLVFSGIQKPARPKAQSFPHGRSLGFSTLKLV